MKHLLIVLATVAVTFAAVAPARATDARGFSVGAPGQMRTSVFPAPLDPWRSWGVRPDRGGPPRAIAEAPRPNPVWVPEHWHWDGFEWEWQEGHWR